MRFSAESGAVLAALTAVMLAGCWGGGDGALRCWPLPRRMQVSELLPLLPDHLRTRGRAGGQAKANTELHAAAAVASEVVRRRDGPGRCD
jgi:hypothetical protein